ncbi:hypothetical protein L218DRAFT_953097 [Marasmius fiardii PR-910]|nr:hypothetical protein L218DRAFT_953097 [Marasmius fiardii PR-910]
MSSSRETHNLENSKRKSAEGNDCELPEPTQKKPRTRVDASKDEVTRTSNNDDKSTIAYLLATIQTLRASISNLQVKNTTLENKVSQLTEELDSKMRSNSEAGSSPFKFTAHHGEPSGSQSQNTPTSSQTAVEQLQSSQRQPSFVIRRRERG